MSVAPTALSLLLLLVAQSDQVVPSSFDAVESTSPPASDEHAPVAAEVTTETEVFDRPDEASYLTGGLHAGDRISIRSVLDGGWLAIDPPGSGKSVFWLERSALSQGPEATGGGRDDRDGVNLAEFRPGDLLTTARRAAVRSGNLKARLPGPPRGFLPKGTIVRPLHIRPVRFGSGPSAILWCAIEPPAGQTYYVRAGDTRALPGTDSPPSETRAVFQTSAGRFAQAPTQGQSALPAEVASEIGSTEAMERAIVSGQPIEQWHFEAVRGRYQALLKRRGDNPAVEEAIRARLARLTRHEQAAEAARTIQSTLQQSHQRDAVVSDIKRRMAVAGASRPRRYSAVGFAKPSSHMFDGRRLYTLVGADGSTVAYLDVPPGLDLEHLVAQRVGVRGPSHYDEGLRARLITVREMESIESKR
jgi:hypothetical protein